MLLSLVPIVILYALSIGLVVLLLVTTYLYGVRWHPVVAVMLWQSIPTALLSLLHYPFHDSLRERFPILPPERPFDQQHTVLGHFCAAEAILLYIFSAVSSGLTVSFTLSLFAVVVKSRRPDLHASARTWRSFRWFWDPTPTALCVGPFVWAVPLLIASMEALVRTHHHRFPSVYYSNTYCNIDDRYYQTVSGISLGVPLIVSVVLIVATIIMLVRIWLQDRRAASSSINAPLALRFSAIVLEIFITAIILICEISLDDKYLRGVFRFHLYWTPLTPMIQFCIFGTQHDLMNTWRYWSCRLVGKEPSFTPRSSNEAMTLSNSSGRGTVLPNECYVIQTTPGAHATTGKVHRASSSAGGRNSTSTADPSDLLAVKRMADSQHIENRDIEMALTAISPGKRSRWGTTSTLTTLPYMPGATTPSTPTDPRSAHFYSSPGDVSSQNFGSALSHSGAHGLLTPHPIPAQTNQPFIVVTDGFGAMFGAQVPPHGALGRPIISAEERERRLAAPGSRTRRPSTGGESSLGRRKSTGLPPPPRSSRPSSARPMSAGLGSLEFGAGERGVSAAGPTPVGAAWNWDSPFRAVGSSGTLAPVGGSDSDSGSRGDGDGIEMQEPNGSFEHGTRPVSHEHTSDGSSAKKLRMSVASDRTFG